MNPTAAAAADTTTPSSDGQGPAKQQPKEKEAPTLSRDTLTHIFAYLSPTEVAGRCAGVASGWRAASDDAWLWGVFLGRQFGEGLAAAASSLSGKRAKSLFAQQYVANEEGWFSKRKTQWDWQTEASREQRWAEIFKDIHLQISVFRDHEPGSEPIFSKLLAMTDTESIEKLFRVGNTNYHGLCMGTLEETMYQVKHYHHFSDEASYDEASSDEEDAADYKISLHSEIRATFSIVDLRRGEPRVATILSGSSFYEKHEWGPPGWTMRIPAYAKDNLRPVTLVEGRKIFDFAPCLLIRATASTTGYIPGYDKECMAEGGGRGVHVHCHVQGKQDMDTDKCEEYCPENDIDREYFEHRFWGIEKVYELIYACLPKLGLQ